MLIVWLTVPPGSPSAAIVTGIVAPASDAGRLPERVPVPLPLSLNWIPREFRLLEGLSDGTGKPSVVDTVYWNGVPALTPNDDALVKTGDALTVRAKD